MARQAQNAVDAGEGDLQLKSLRHRLAIDPRDLDARILLARFYVNKGFTDLGLEHYRMAAAAFPDSVLPALGVAKTLREMRELPAALDATREFLARHSQAWELLSLQGILEDEQGHFSAAEPAHRAALAIEVGQSALHNNLGYNLLLQGKTDAAVAEFELAIAAAPHSRIATNNLGTALALKSHPEEALAQWRSADPAVAHNNLGAVLIEQGRYAEARAELETALSFHRDFSPVLGNLKLVAEHDGQGVSIPGRKARLNFWKRPAASKVKAPPADEAVSIASAADPNRK